MGEVVATAPTVGANQVGLLLGVLTLSGNWLKLNTSQTEPEISRNSLNIKT